MFSSPEARQCPGFPTQAPRHGAAIAMLAMLEDSEDDAVFVRDQFGHRNIRDTLQFAALSEAKRREKAAKLRIAPETWR